MSILVVSRDPAKLEAALDVLQSGGYECHPATTGRAAMSVFRANAPEAALIIDDNQDDIMLKVCTAIRKYEESMEEPVYTQIFLVIQEDSLENRENGFNAGASDFIPLAMLLERKEWLLARLDETLRPGRMFEGLQALLVEDSPATARILTWCLKLCGLKVKHAPDGVSAYAMARELRDELDLVITEYRLPEMGGSELCQRLRTILGLRRIPILFICSEEDSEEVLEAFSIGATDYIIKPCIKEEILARLRVHLDIRAFSQRLKKQLNSLRGKEVFRTGDTDSNTAIEGDRDLSGALEAMSMPEIVQLLRLSKRTGRLVILDQDQNMGNLYVLNGNGQFADYLDSEGDQAIYKMFSLTRGVFAFHSNETTTRRNLKRSLDFILMDAVRMMDERV